MIETKAAFAGCTKRSLRLIFSSVRLRLRTKVQSINESFRHSPELQKEMLVGHDTKKNQEFRFFVLSMQQATIRIKKNQFETGDKLQTSRFDPPSRKAYEPQFTQEFLEIVAIVSSRTPT